jgi:hypothetical protein
MEDVPAATPISTMHPQNRLVIPSKIVFCDRNVLSDQVVDEFASARATESREEQVLTGDCVPTARSTNATNFKDPSIIPLV